MIAGDFNVPSSVATLRELELGQWGFSAPRESTTCSCGERRRSAPSRLAGRPAELGESSLSDHAPVEREIAMTFDECARSSRCSSGSRT